MAKELEQNNDLESVETGDLDEEVAAATASEDDVTSEPTGADDQAQTEGDETDAAAAEIPGAETEVPARPQGADEAKNLQAQLLYLQQQMQQQQQYFQYLLQQQGRPAPPAPTPPPPEEDVIPIPDEVEGFSQRELARYAVKEAAKLAQRKVKQQQAVYDYQLNTVTQVMDAMFAGHPEYPHIQTALRVMQSNPGLTFAGAFQAVKGTAALQQLTQLQNQQRNRQKADQKRMQQAKLQSRKPVPAPKKATKFTGTFREAFDESMREYGMK